VNANRPITYSRNDLIRRGAYGSGLSPSRAIRLLKNEGCGAENEQRGEENVKLINPEPDTCSGSADYRFPRLPLGTASIFANRESSL
jgi:hypothetical protein